MSKKMNIKSINLDAINPYFVACNDLVAERARYNKVKTPIVADRDKLLEAQEKARLDGLMDENIDAMLSDNGYTIFELNRKIDAEKTTHATINKGINARIREVVKQYCPKEDDMYAAYASLDGSDEFAKMLLGMFASLGAHINDPKRASKQIAHITGWRNKDGRKVPESRASFTKSIFNGIKTMLAPIDADGNVLENSLCVELQDGSLMWRKDLKGEE